MEERECNMESSVASRYSMLFIIVRSKNHWRGSRKNWNKLEQIIKQQYQGKGMVDPTETDIV